MIRCFVTKTRCLCLTEMNYSWKRTTNFKVISKEGPSKLLLMVGRALFKIWSLEMEGMNDNVEKRSLQERCTIIVLSHIFFR